MDIHEYQAKEILGRFGVTVPDGGLAYSPEQAAYRARELGGNRWIVKAQVHAGGRGKAGGVKLCDSEGEILDAADEMFGKKLVTHQTGPEGKGVYRVYVEAAVPFEREIYLGTEDSLLDLVYTLPEDIDSVMLVGHNPVMTGFAQMLQARLTEDLPTSAVVSISFDTDDWTRILLSDMKLNFIIFPRML